MEKRSLGYRVGHFLFIGWMDGTVSLLGWAMILWVGYGFAKFFLKPFAVALMARIFG